TGTMKHNPKNRRTKEPKVDRRVTAFLWCFGALVLALPTALCSQDTVIYSTAPDPAARIKKTGVILEFTGTELRLRNTLRAGERGVPPPLGWLKSKHSGLRRTRPGGPLAARAGWTMRLPHSGKPSETKRGPGLCGKSWRTWSAVTWIPAVSTAAATSSSAFW